MWECIGVKTPIRKKEKSLAMPVKFLVIFDGVYLLMIVFLFPLWENEWHIFINLILGVLSMITWFIVQFSDPGYVRKPKNLDFM